MRISKFLFPFVAVLLAAIPLRAGQIPAMGNDSFSARLTMRGGRILSSDLILDGQALTVQDQAPAFEFCLNGSVVKASDPCWRFSGLQTKDLSNGGRIYSYEFQGRGKWKGLILYWDREVFPDVALLRERLRLTASRPGFGYAMWVVGTISSFPGTPWLPPGRPWGKKSGSDASKQRRNWTRTTCSIRTAIRWTCPPGK